MGMEELPWTVYILECADRTLYTGISQNLERRIAAHEQGKGARYTKSRGPFTIRYEECLETKGAALKRERAIKSMSRKEKIKLISEIGMVKQLDRTG